MDVKAMARSKRSHTKHHQPRKPYRPNTPATPSSSSSPNVPGVLKEGEKKKSNMGSSLPSNWDRYHDSDEDEGLIGSESGSAVGPGPDAAKTDVVKPKSKGADFGFLISQAKSQSPANFSPSFDDILPDFCQGLESMLSVKGENILSWTTDDNFCMEDEAATTKEVPFLSLNLQTLAEELASIDLAQRLFIEEDILPPELRTPQKDEKDGTMPGSSSADLSSKEHDLAFRCSSQSDSVGTTIPTSLSFRQKGQLDDSVAAHESDSLRAFNPKESFKTTQEAETDNKMSRFDAKAVETELDMLLDSFNETMFIDSSTADSNAPSASALSEQKNSAFSHTRLDSLANGATSNDSIQPGTKSKVMEDFDSWLDSM